MKNHIDSNFAIAILSLVAACVGFSFWFLAVSNEMTSESSYIVPVHGEETEDGMDNLTLTNDRMTMDREAKEYVSEELGVRFTYANHPWDGSEIVIEEGENSIWFGGKSSDRKLPDLEVITLEKNLSHKEAIYKQFIATPGVSYEKECFVEILTNENYYPSNYEQAIISHPLATNESRKEPIWIVVPQHCPPAYSVANGRQFFYYNKDIPGKAVFIRTGQDSVAADGDGNDWSYSLEIFK